jgi:hypothetical protein
VERGRGRPRGGNDYVRTDVSALPALSSFDSFSQSNSHTSMQACFQCYLRKQSFPQCASWKPVAQHVLSPTSELPAHPPHLQNND